MKMAIIGAGMGGMAAALDLNKAGHEVEIFESTDHPGGLAGGFKEPDWEWSVEKFYHHWFTTDAAMMALIDELGLRDMLIVKRPYTVMYFKGNFYPFDSILTAMLYPGLGWGLDKIRFGLVGLFLRLTGNWHPMEKVTVDQWMRKWAGERVYSQMWEPMVFGKFGERYAKVVNMAWMWARLHARTTKLATFEGGFQNFSNLFCENLQKRGVKFYFNTLISLVKPTLDGKICINIAGEEKIFDRCLVTISPGQMAKMTPDLPADYLKGLLELKSLGAVVMVVSLLRPLSPQGYYWYNLPKSAGFPFLALVEHTNFLPAEKYGGENLIYCGDYLEINHEYFKMTKEELLEKFLPSFSKINPEFTPEWVQKSWLFKTNYAQPVPLVNHSNNIPAIRTPLKGVYFACMSQVYPWDRGTNFAVQIARQAALMILDDASISKD
ncbi:MAG: NAD(P)/FAD-dependent oxidoreductase [Anaerolineaceae bacterium]